MPRLITFRVSFISMCGSPRLEIVAQKVASRLPPNSDIAAELATVQIFGLLEVQGNAGGHCPCLLCWGILLLDSQFNMCFVMPLTTFSCISLTCIHATLCGLAASASGKQLSTHTSWLSIPAGTGKSMQGAGEK